MGKIVERERGEREGEIGGGGWLVMGRRIYGKMGSHRFLRDLHSMQLTVFFCLFKKKINFKSFLESKLI